MLGYGPCFFFSWSVYSVFCTSCTNCILLTCGSCWLIVNVVNRKLGGKSWFGLNPTFPTCHVLVGWYFYKETRNVNCVSPAIDTY